MIIKKIVEQEPEKVKPFKEGEVIKFPCGGTVTIEHWGSGGVILVLQPRSYSKHDFIRFCVSNDALEMLPMLSERGLATTKSAKY